MEWSNKESLLNLSSQPKPHPECQAPSALEPDTWLAPNKGNPFPKNYSSSWVPFAGISPSSNPISNLDMWNCTLEPTNCLPLSLAMCHIHHQVLWTGPQISPPCVHTAALTLRPLRGFPGPPVSSLASFWPFSILTIFLDSLTPIKGVSYR